MSKPILYIEDSDTDILLMQHAMKTAGLEDQFQALASAEEAKAQLESRPPPPPSVILLDLKLVGMSGLEFLAWLKRHPRLRRVPVVVISSSDLPGDLEQAYDLGASSFLTKPDGLRGYKEMTELLGRYWLRLNRLPEYGKPERP